MMTSSGSASSRMRGSSLGACRAPSAPCSTRMPRLRGSSSTKPTGRSRASGLRRISRSTSRPPSPAPTISTSRASAAGAEAAQRPLEQRPREEARAAARSASVSRKNSASDAGRQLDRDVAARRVETLTGCTIGDRSRRAPASRRRRACSDALVVALVDVAPPLLVQAERARRSPGCRTTAETIVRSSRSGSGRACRGRSAAEREPVGERDQAAVHRELRERMAMDGKGRGADPSAHRGAL